MVIFAAATVLRPAEWLALGWRDIDRGARVVHVHRTSADASSSCARRLRWLRMNGEDEPEINLNRALYRAIEGFVSVGDARRRPDAHLVHPVVWALSPQDWLLSAA